MFIDRIKSRAELITGLDIGSSKICVVIGQVSNDGISIISVTSIPSSGVQKGVIKDINATANCIRKAFNVAEKFVGKKINRIFVGIGGSHIKNFSNIGSSTIVSGMVTENDILTALGAAVDLEIPQDKEIIHIVPSDFLIDGRGGIPNPVGMNGDMLEVKTLIFISDKTALQNLIQCCEIAEIKIEDIIFQPLASAEASLSYHQRENGVAIIDIGGGTTEILIYGNEMLKHAVTFGIGGNHFTNDLSIVLKIPFNEAERIKLNDGYIMSDAPDEENEIAVVNIDGNKHFLDQNNISEILLARSEELLELIKNEIDRSVDLYGSLTEVMLTGGACLLPGFRRLAAEILSIPVRIAYPEMVSKKFNKNSNISEQLCILDSVDSEFNQPLYAAGIGLVLYGAGRLSVSNKIASKPYTSLNIASKLTGWVKNLR